MVIVYYAGRPTAQERFRQYQDAYQQFEIRTRKALKGRNQDQWLETAFFEVRDELLGDDNDGAWNDAALNRLRDDMSIES